ncbi:MAG TPA: ROK family protein [Pirellulales bacterium]|nr:ROK family protein [Pirellulales bacterium]
MFLGIEIGGTKLQLGVGKRSGPPLVKLVRHDVRIEDGAQGILKQIRAAARPLVAAHDVERIGVGFGGPLAADGRRTVKSHQVAGWDNFPLADWCEKELGAPTVLGNDADLAGLAEAHFGAGRGHDPIFYITVGTGIGGGFIVDRRIYRGSGHGAAEIGHLRPGLDAVDSQATLESRAAGPGIVATVRRLIPTAATSDVADLSARTDDDLELLTAKTIGEAAAAGNQLALDGLGESRRALAWAIAQVITLLSPPAVVIGGGVSLLGEKLFFAPLRAEVERYVFPPFRGTYQILPAQLGEEMVVYGALALAAEADSPRRHGDTEKN